MLDHDNRVHMSANIVRFAKRRKKYLILVLVLVIDLNAKSAFPEPPARG
jgi:hypothetical protein